jgi:hypothetical protein
VRGLEFLLFDGGMDLSCSLSGDTWVSFHWGGGRPPST